MLYIGVVNLDKICNWSFESKEIIPCGYRFLLLDENTIGKGICRCISAEHGENELELTPDDILADGLLKKGVKEQNQLEVAIGDGMEFTIHGELMNNSKVNMICHKINSIQYIYGYM